METIPNEVVERQNEIQQLVQLLKEFRPTKIAVERDENEFEELNREYKQYLNHDHELRPDEVDQIAFRLAEKCEHKELFPVNWSGRITKEELSRLFRVAQENYSALFERMTKFQNEQLDMEKDPKVPFIEVYRQLNDLELMEQLKQIYLSFSTIEQEEQKIGTAFLTKWMERELRIFSNALQLADNEFDRILLLIGSDHIWMLRQLFEGSGLFHVEDCHAYLSNHGEKHS